MNARAPLLVVTVLLSALPSAAHSPVREIDGGLSPAARRQAGSGQTRPPAGKAGPGSERVAVQDASGPPPGTGNVVNVALSGGDFTSVQAALDSITDAGETNPYLVLVGPGWYQEQVAMKPFVDIQGSGREVTVITWTVTGQGNVTLLGADDAELRQLTVSVTSTELGDGWAIRNVGTSPRITDVEATSSALSQGGGAISNESGAAPALSNVVATATGAQTIAIRNLGASPTLTLVEASTNGDGTVAISNTSGSEAALFQVVAEATAGTAEGSVQAVAVSGGTLQLADVVAVASGGDTNVGVFIEADASVEAARVSASAVGSGGSACYGIQIAASDLTLTEGDVEASGCGSSNQAIRSFQSTWEASDSVLEASSTSSYGVYNFGGGDLCATGVITSQVAGDTAAVYTADGCSTRIALSLLSGGTAGPGSTLCAGVADDETKFYPSTCPPMDE